MKFLEEFAPFAPLADLLKAGGARVTTLAKLPTTHQIALIHYMSVDGAAWAVGHHAFEDWKWGEGKSDKLRTQQLNDCRKFLPRFLKHFGRSRFGYASVPTKGLLDVMLKHHPYAREHAKMDYKFNGVYKCPTWPVILIDSFEIIEDGWNRFFNRMVLNIKMTPVVWYA